MSSRTFGSDIHQRFPVGTSVSVYPAVSPGLLDRGPSGTAVTTATVGAGGVTFTGLTDNTAYHVYGLVGGQHRYLAFHISASTPGVVWKDVVASRRAARGTS